MRPRRVLAAVVLAGVTLGRWSAGVAIAGSAADVLGRLHQLDDGPRKWSDRTQRVRLRIVGDAGKERVREFESFNKHYPGGEEKALLFFQAPPELRGTGFLQWAHLDRDDEQWLYLPELKRIRQIAAGAKKESFAGTDFSYRELEILGEITRWTDKEAAASLDGEESVGGVPAQIVAFKPRDVEAIGYDKLRIWLRADDLVLVRVEFIGADGPMKRLALEDIRTVGAIPTPYRLDMRNLKTGGHTIVEVQEIAYDRGLADELFTQRALEQGQP